MLKANHKDTEATSLYRHFAVAVVFNYEQVFPNWVTRE